MLEAEAWAVTAGGTAGVAKAGEVAHTAVRRETQRPGDRQEADHGHGATQHLGGRGRAGGKTASKKGRGGIKTHKRCFF